MRRLFVPLVTLLACGGPLPELEQSTANSPLAHEVEVQEEDGVGRMTVRRTFSTFDPTLELSIPLPSGASVDRFAFAVDGRWYPADLVDAELAEERYMLLSGLAGRDDLTTEGALPPALLAWEARGELTLKAHPLPPGSTVEIQYRITAPTCHVDGRPVLDYPHNPDDQPVIVGTGDVWEAAEDWTDACDDGATLVEGERLILGLPPLEVGHVRATYAVQPMVGGKSLVRIAIDAPPELAALPERARVVFVMDASVSQEDAKLEDQLAWAAAYLEWVPDASVEVVLFRRFAEPLFGRFVPATEFGDALREVPPERLLPGNGSHADRGIDLAAELLAGPGRIVVTSDLLVRTGFDPEVAADVVPAQAVLHVLQRVPEEGTPSVSVARDGLFSMAARSGGLGAQLSGDPFEEGAVVVAEELVRPIRLDDVTTIGAEERVWRPDLPRGKTIRSFEREPPGGQIQGVTGRLWSREVRFDVIRSPELDEAMPAILIGTDQVHLLAEEQVRALAEVGGVVSPYTSYLAELGGAEPTEAPMQLGCLGGFGSGFSSRCGCGIGGRGVGIATGGHVRWLEAEVEQARADCAATGPVEVETTRHEIVDVHTEDECLRESLWEIRLPDFFRSLGGVRTFRF